MPLKVAPRMDGSFRGEAHPAFQGKGGALLRPAPGGEKKVAPGGAGKNLSGMDRSDLLGNERPAPAVAPEGARHGARGPSPSLEGAARAPVSGEEGPAASPTREGPQPAPTRCGYLTLLGRPNAGKSTLLNALVGEPLSIVTPRAQTTWRRVTGVLTLPDAQMVILDTPGLLTPRDLLQRSMLHSAVEAVREADILLLLVDGTKGFTEGEAQRVEAIRKENSQVPFLTAVNKVDRVPTEAALHLAGLLRQRFGGNCHLISALRGDGVEALRKDLVGLLPPGPFLFPADEIAREPVRFFVGEFVRESAFELFREEIPYSLYCVVEEFREAQDPVYVRAVVAVERRSQKRIVVGKGGEGIKELGSRARRRIEAFLGRRVYLDLWVKVVPNWRRKTQHLRAMGFPLPPPSNPAGKL